MGSEEMKTKGDSNEFSSCHLSCNSNISIFPGPLITLDLIKLYCYSVKDGDDIKRLKRDNF